VNGLLKSILLRFFYLLLQKLQFQIVIGIIEAMIETSSQTIEHLIEVENRASSIIDEAQKTAEKKINEAKTLADEQYSAKYSEECGRLEKIFNEELEKIDLNTKNIMEDYRQSLLKLKTDKTSFFALVDNILKQGVR